MEQNIGKMDNRAINLKKIIKNGEKNPKNSCMIRINLNEFTVRRRKPEEKRSGRNKLEEN
jgi:hypothetical protein